MLPWLVSMRNLPPPPSPTSSAPAASLPPSSSAGGEVRQSVAAGDAKPAGELQEGEGGGAQRRAPAGDSVEEMLTEEMDAKGMRLLSHFLYPMVVVRASFSPLPHNTICRSPPSPSPSLPLSLFSSLPPAWFPAPVSTLPSFVPPSLPGL